MENLSFFDTPLIDTTGMWELLVRFGITMLMVCVVVCGFYYPKAHRRDYLFTFLMFSVSIFMLIFLMEGSKLKIGAALGLFAIFGILRYRTEAVPIREMTYLFLVVTMSVVNAMGTKLSLAELLLANFMFIAVVCMLEYAMKVRSRSSKYVKYDKIDLIRPEKYDELVADLEERLGLKVVRVEVGSVDFLKDMALLRVYYYNKDGKGNSVDHMNKLPRNYED